MAPELKKDLDETTQDFIKKIRGNLAASGTDATLESSKSLHYELTESGKDGATIEVLAKPYFSVVETGRKATPDKKPSRDMITNLEKWLEARGKPDSLVWAIAMSIVKKGTALFRKGGRTDIYTDLKEPFVDDVSKVYMKHMADKMFDDITIAFK